VAPVFGRTPTQARAALVSAGFALHSDEASLASVVGSDRGKLARALAALADTGP
jgi:hypothetical protein